MTATNFNLLKNLFLERSAKKLKDGDFIPDEQYAGIKADLELPKTNHNYLLRFGFFLLGCLLYGSFVRLLSLITMNAIEDIYQFLLFAFAAIGLAASEVLTRQKYHNHGLDDAFILGFMLAFSCAVGVATDSVWAVYLAMALTGLFCTLRYVHTISTFVALFGIAGFVASLATEFQIIDMIFLPFLMLLTAIALYAAFLKLIVRPKSFLYHNNILAVQVFSLVLGYLSVNYLIVRTLSLELMGTVINPNEDISMAWIFYILTFLIPIAYISYALFKKDRIILYIGMATFAFGLYSIFYYYIFLPADMALILGGILLFGFSVITIRKLKGNETGITFEKDRHANSESLAYAQAIIVNSHAGISAAQAPESPMTFGGGGFSGGGAGESF